MSTSVAIAEQQLLNYLWDYPDKISKFDRNYFLSSIGKTLFETLSILYREGVGFSSDSVISVASDHNSAIDENTISSLRHQTYDTDSFDFYFRSLREKWVKEDLSNRVLKEILHESESKNPIDIDRLSDLGTDLQYDIEIIQGKESIVLDIHDMFDRYDDALDLRKRGLHAYTSGDPFLDEQLIVGMLPGQISLMFGATGTGKSAYALNLINLNLNQRLASIYCSLEMDTISTMDRLVAQRIRVPVQSLYPNAEGVLRDDVIEKYERERERTKKHSSLLFVEEPGLSLKDIEVIIREGKKKFDQDYFKIFIDLLTMVKEFSGGDPKEYEEAMNYLHSIAKRNNVHIIGVVQANRTTDMVRVDVIDHVTRMRPQIHHVKNSGALAERSRIVLGVFRPRYYAQRLFPDDPELATMDDVMEIQILKQSQGDVGHIIPYLFQAEQFRITPMRLIAEREELPRLTVDNDELEEDLFVEDEVDEDSESESEEIIDP